MEKIKKIMVACDFSEYSKEALEYAAELAEDLKADLIVTHVINQRDVNTVRQASNISVAVSVEEFIKHRMENRSNQIKKLIEETSLSHLPGCDVFLDGDEMCYRTLRIKNG